MKIRLHEYNLPLTHPFTISRGTITVQDTTAPALALAGQPGLDNSAGPDASHAANGHLEPASLRGRWLFHRPSERGLPRPSCARDGAETAPAFISSRPWC